MRPGTSAPTRWRPPLLASDSALRALPPLWLNAAGLDPLRSESEALAGRLAALGRPETLRLHDGVVHGFMQMTGALDEADSAFTEAGKACRRLLELGD